jgi:hypothetical protein
MLYMLLYPQIYYDPINLNSSNTNTNNIDNTNINTNKLEDYTPQYSQKYHIIESPDGQIQIGSLKDVDIIDNKNIQEHNIQEHNIQISNQIENDGVLYIQIRNKALLVRFFCLMDFSFHFILISFANIYPLNFIVIIASYAGFESTYTYNKNSIILYLLYQYIQTCFKLFLFTCWLISILIHDTKEISTINNMLFIENSPVYILFFFCVCLSQLFITYQVQSFYLLLSRV